VADSDPARLVPPGRMVAIAIDLDTSVALRGTNDLRRLVQAVVDADDHHEADWVDWKSTLGPDGEGGMLPRGEGRPRHGESRSGPGRDHV
jgi:hypothetical protein